MRRTSAASFMCAMGLVGAMMLSATLSVAVTTTPASADISDVPSNLCTASNQAAANFGFLAFLAPSLAAFTPPACVTQPVDCGDVNICDFTVAVKPSAVVGRATATVEFQGHLTDTDFIAASHAPPADGWVDLESSGKRTVEINDPNPFPLITVASCTSGNQGSVFQSCPAALTIHGVPSGSSLNNEWTDELFPGHPVIQVSMDRYRAICRYGPLTSTEVVIAPSMLCSASAVPHTG